jgi:hypothetical protein
MTARSRPAKLCKLWAGTFAELINCLFLWLSQTSQILQATVAPRPRSVHKIIVWTEKRQNTQVLICPYLADCPYISEYNLWLVSEPSPRSNLHLQTVSSPWSVWLLLLSLKKQHGAVFAQQLTDGRQSTLDVCIINTRKIYKKINPFLHTWFRDSCFTCDSPQPCRFSPCFLT